MSEKLYLLGHPIGHSKSPLMYNALYQQLGLSWHYDLADCATEDEARDLLAARDFLSVNITTPYKPLAFEMAQAKAASAKLARGANLLINCGGTLVGYNVDGEGCVSYLERIGFDFHGAKVVVCGTGPTALAILHACGIAGADRLVLLGRDHDRTQRALQSYRDTYRTLLEGSIDLPAAREGWRSFREAYRAVQLIHGSYVTSTQAISEADLIVNATPLGMHPGDAAPFDLSLLRPEQVVFDCVYGHGETALVAAARERGCAAYDGEGMLVAQAVASACALLDAEQVTCAMSQDDMFALMATAAEFDL